MHEATSYSYVTLAEFVRACIDRERGLTPKDCEGFVKFYGNEAMELLYAKGKRMKAGEREDKIMQS